MRSRLAARGWGVLLLVELVVARDALQRAKAAREAGYRLGSDRGSPNHGSTLASNRVMAQIWPPARVST
jgi:hypothetical protein